MKKKIRCYGFHIRKIKDKIYAGELPSHLLYGLKELNADDYEVEYTDYNHSGGPLGLLKLAKEILSLKEDVIYIPFLNASIVKFLLILKCLGLKRSKMVGIFHATPEVGWFGRFLFRRLDYVFFHSPKNMQECFDRRIAVLSKTELLSWGMDIPYYDAFTSPDLHEFFISTGIENRAYGALLQASRANQIPLKIVLPERFRGLYDYMNDCTEDELIYMPDTPHLYEDLTALSRRAIAYIIPLNTKMIRYCVGLTSIYEAMALGKPIIVTDNPYHPFDVEDFGIGIKVKEDTPECWAEVLLRLQNEPDLASRMSKKARWLAEERYNVHECAKQINRIFDRVLQG